MGVFQSTLGNIIYLKDNTRLESPGKPGSTRKATAESITEEVPWNSRKHHRGKVEAGHGTRMTNVSVWVFSLSENT